MSGGAIIGAAAIGAGSSYLSAKSQSKAASAAYSSADAASQLEYEVSMEQLNFAKEQYSDWEDIFGPVQQNLSDYYSNISADSVASQGIQSIEQEFTRSRQALDTALAKRGITNSGATAQSLTDLESTRMLGRADVQANAASEAAQQQANFMNLGYGQQAQLQNSISSAYSNQMSSLGNQASTQLGLAQNYSNNAAQAYSGIGSSIGSGISSYMTYSALNPTNTNQSWLTNNASVASGAIAYGN